MDLNVINQSRSQLYIKATKDDVHFCVVTIDGEQHDFSIRGFEWELMKSFIEQNMNLTDEE